MSPRPADQGRVSEASTDLIDFKELVLVLWAGKKVVLWFTGTVAIGAILFAFWLPDVYESRILLAPKGEDGAAGLAGLARQYGGLASLAGLNISSGSDGLTKSQIALEKIRSLGFFTRHLYEETLVDLMALDAWDAITRTPQYDPNAYNVKDKRWVRQVSYPRQMKPSAQEAYEEYLSILSVSEDGNIGLITLSVQHRSAVFAEALLSKIVEGVSNELRGADIQEAKESIEFLEAQLKETTLVSLENVFIQLIEEQTKTIMLANVSKDYVFDIIDRPVVAESAAKPQRLLICGLGAMGGMLLGLLVVLIHSYSRSWTLKV